MTPRELFILSLLGGLSVCSIWAMVYPRMPKIRIKNLEIFPSIRIIFKTRVYHLHHWFYYLIILSVSVFIDNGILTSIPLRGYLIGGVLKEFILPSKRFGSLPRKLKYKTPN